MVVCRNLSSHRNPTSLFSMYRSASSLSQCSICLNRVETRTTAALIPCAHAYCVGCIRRWSEVKRSCPLCNGSFDSWICITEYGFREHKLLPLHGSARGDSGSRSNVALQSRRRRQLQFDVRLIRRTREASGTKPQPRRRSFRRKNGESLELVAERVRKWRASIYKQRLQAVPPYPTNGLLQQISVDTRAKEIILRQIEPWLHRELQALLDDPDPTIIVHVVTSLFISRYEKHADQSRVNEEGDFLTPLRPFLDQHTEMFWHELRCFAECTLNMETWDAVVEYRAMDSQNLDR